MSARLLVGIALEFDAAEEEHLVMVSRGGGEHARGTGPGGEFAPSPRFRLEIEGPCVMASHGIGRLPLTTEDIDDVVGEDTASVGHGFGEWWEGGEFDKTVLELHQEACIRVGGCIATAEAKKTLREGEGDAISDGVWQGSDGCPFSGFEMHGVDRIMPDFGSFFPRWTIGEIGTASDEEVSLADSGEGSGEAEWIGEIGSSIPLEIGLAPQQLRCHEEQEDDEV